MFVYICALSHFALIGGIWQLSRREATGELEREWREYVFTSSPSFCRPAAKAPVLAPLAGYVKKKTNELQRSIS